jgi:iron complex transport system permease protein
LALFLADVASGSVRIPVGDVASALMGTGTGNPAWDKIVLLFRLPKAIAALVAGACLAVSGLLLQTLFANPLAGPDVLGTNSGASIAVALVILASGSASGTAFLEGTGLAGSAILALGSSLGAALITAVILAVASRVEGANAILIVGLLVGFMAGSLVSFLVYFALPQKVPVYLAWTYGSFQGVTRAQLPVLSGIGSCALALSFALAKPLDALLLGERYAYSSGVNVRLARSAIVATSALLCGAVTAFCGPVAFLGIAAPHAARGLMRTQRHALLIPASLLCGSVFALGADLLTQIPLSGAVLPLNPLLALTGAPVILAIVLRRGAGGSR